MHDAVAAVRRPRPSAQDFPAPVPLPRRRYQRRDGRHRSAPGGEFPLAQHGPDERATNPDEYPVEFLYREVLSKEQLLEALSFFLVRVPKREAEEDKPERPAFTLFPRYHQSRTGAEGRGGHLGALRRERRHRPQISMQTIPPAAAKRSQSAGWPTGCTACSSPARTKSWWTSRSSSPTAKSLDTNIREDIENFTHLKDVVGIAKKAEDLPRFLKERKPIIVTTQQKFAWVLEELQKNPALKKLRVAFLIDEAHRSQEGQMGAAIRLPFRKTDEPDAEAPEQDPEEQIAKVIREHDSNQLFVAFTATPAPATVDLFGKPFDTYTEAEAIAEGYIVDVAASIISYKTLYNLHCHFVPPPGEEEKLYPKGRRVQGA